NPSSYMACESHFSLNFAGHYSRSLKKASTFWLFSEFNLTALDLGSFAARRAAFGSAVTLVARHRIMLKDVAFVDPDLHADDPVGRQRFGCAVVKVGAKRVQRHAAFAVPFHAGDVG